MKVFFETAKPKKFASRTNTSEIIFKAYKLKYLEQSRNTRNVLFILSLVFALNILIMITILQYNIYVNK